MHNADQKLKSRDFDTLVFAKTKIRGIFFAKVREAKNHPQLPKIQHETPPFFADLTPNHPPTLWIIPYSGKQRRLWWGFPGGCCGVRVGPAPTNRPPQKDIYTYTPQKKLMWHWKISILNRTYIFIHGGFPLSCWLFFGGYSIICISYFTHLW